MFDLDEFLSECDATRSESEPRRAIAELLRRTVSTGREVADVLQPRRAGLTVLLQSPDLTVLHAVWAPKMTLFPHDHRMWAAIGIYQGGEDNAFYRRSAADRRRLDESGGREIRDGDVLSLGDDVIHQVTNPFGRPTGAIHAYGGDFVNRPRSQWGPGEREERPFDMEDFQRAFAEADARRPDER